MPRLALHSLPLLLLFAAAAAAGAGAPAPAAPDAKWASDLAEWKQWRDGRLRQPDSWLTLVGLAWLQPGNNGVGSHPANRVVLPTSAAGSLGVLRLDGERVTFLASPGAKVTADGAPVTTIDMKSDATGEPTVLHSGSVQFYVIRRSDRLAVRVKDSEAQALKKFTGLEYYPADARWRVEARFEPSVPAGEIEVPNALGFTEKIASPGHVVFTLGGVEHRLLALDDTGDGRLFLVFGDKTNGRETYGGGRFLYTDPPRDGKVTIDFNRAYNPPCVFSPYATCPLPPPGNRMPIAVEAGEKKYALAVHS
jgi:uncharacterized protein